MPKELKCSVIMRAGAIARCPNDPSQMISYQIFVKPSVFMPAEELVAAIKSVGEEPIFQEDLTVALAEKLRPYDAIVALIGVHCGVAIHTASL
jgi:hypothetical protein